MQREEEKAQKQKMTLVFSSGWDKYVFYFIFFITQYTSCISSGDRKGVPPRNRRIVVEPIPITTEAFFFFDCQFLFLKWMIESYDLVRKDRTMKRKKENRE